MKPILKFIILLLLTSNTFGCGNSKQPKATTPIVLDQDQISERFDSVVFDDIVTPNGFRAFSYGNNGETLALVVRLTPTFFLCEIEYQGLKKLVIDSSPITVDIERRGIYLVRDGKEMFIGQVHYNKVDGHWQHVPYPCDFGQCEVRAKLTKDKNQDIQCEISLIATTAEKELLFKGTSSAR